MKYSLPSDVFSKKSSPRISTFFCLTSRALAIGDITARHAHSAVMELSFMMAGRQRAFLTVTEPEKWFLPQILNFNRHFWLACMKLMELGSIPRILKNFTRYNARGHITNGPAHQQPTPDLLWHASHCRRQSCCQDPGEDTETDVILLHKFKMSSQFFWRFI